MSRMAPDRTLFSPLQALVVKLQQDAYKFPDRIAEFKVQTQGAAEQTPGAVQAPPGPVPVPVPPAASARVLGLPQGVVHLPGGAPSPHDGGGLLLNPLALQQQSEALEDVLQSAGAAHHQLGAGEAWPFPSFGVGAGAGGFDARDPFDVQFSGSQPCGLLLSSTGARL